MSNVECRMKNSNGTILHSSFDILHSTFFIRHSSSDILDPTFKFTLPSPLALPSLRRREGRADARFRL